MQNHQWQMFFFIIGIMGSYFPIMTAFATLEQRTWLFETYQESSEQRWNRFSDFIITLTAGILSFITNKVMNKFTWNFFYKNCREKQDEDIRVAKTQKSCNSLYKALYYIGSTAWGYWILKDESILPPMLLGNGNLSNLYNDYPHYNWKAGNNYFRYYYLSTMGYHIHQMIYFATNEMRNDFVEMNLHHITTILLYG